MINSFFCLLILFSISCNANSDSLKVLQDTNSIGNNNDLSENYNIITGEWLHNDDLHLELSKKYMKEDVRKVKNDSNLTEEEKNAIIEDYIPKGKLTGENAFGEIRMVFKEDSTYSSYFDKQFYYGNWKLDNDSLFMKRNDIQNKWIGYNYKLYDNNLIILHGQWLMTFTKIPNHLMLPKKDN